MNPETWKHKSIHCDELHFIISEDSEIPMLHINDDTKMIKIENNPSQENNDILSRREPGHSKNSKDKQSNSSEGLPVALYAGLYSF